MPEPLTPERLLALREIEAEAVAKVLSGKVFSEGRLRMQTFCDDVSAVGDHVYYTKHGYKFQLVVHNITE